ncbi:hypothetical protein ScPMuIL_018312 [Solemya velum]
MDKSGEVNIKNLQNMMNDGEHDFNLDKPDIQKLRQDRMERNKKTMKAADSGIAEKLFPEKSKKSPEEAAAICIQKHFRGYMSRKKYVEYLFEQFTREEQKQLLRVQQQMEEGELLVENHKLEVLFDDDNTVRRNKDRNFRSKIILIQRQWRAHLRRQRADVAEEQTFSFNLQDEAENSETESAQGTQIMTPSTPDENTLNLESPPEDDKQKGFTTAEVAQLCVQIEKEADSESILSDYSEVVGPLRDLEENGVVIVQKCDLDKNSFSCLSKLDGESSLEKKTGETDEDFDRRQKKLNFLSLAQEFAELKKLNAAALPFDLHNLQIVSPESDSVSLTEIQPNCLPLEEPRMDLGRQNEFLNNNSENDINRNIVKTDKSYHDERDCRERSDSGNISNLYISTTNSKNNVVSNISTESECNKDSGQLMEKSSDKGSNMSKSESSGDFDVYNIETALPPMDWETLEKQLELAAEEEEKRQFAQRNDREEIRRKLAMGTDEEFYCNDKSYKKQNLHSRLQSGMNLQICFMNETNNDEDGTARTSESDISPSSSPKPLETESLKPKAAGTLPTQQSPRPPHDGTTGMPADKKVAEDEDFTKKHTRLQNEAKLALAQAGTMAHMQLQLEKQMKKKSPIAEIVGVPIFGDGRRKRMSSRIFQDMNLAQIQVLVNDLHSQIENLNEELVKLLMERDELHMEQDSKLVDVEDLRRRAEECANRVNTKQKKEKKK